MDLWNALHDARPINAPTLLPIAIVGAALFAALVFTMDRLEKTKKHPRYLIAASIAAAVVGLGTLAGTYATAVDIQADSENARSNLLATHLLTEYGLITLEPVSIGSSTATATAIAADGTVVTVHIAWLTHATPVLPETALPANFEPVTVTIEPAATD